MDKQHHIFALILFLLLPGTVMAETEQIFPYTGIRPSYVSIGLAGPTPAETDFLFGLGPYVLVGWNTPIGLLEWERFDTHMPAKSDYSYNVNQKRVAGTSSTDYYAEATSIYYGKIFDIGQGSFAKLRLGIADYKYRVERANISDSKSGRAWLTFGGGAGFELNERFFFIMDYTFIDKLMSNLNFGVLYKL